MKRNRKISLFCCIMVILSMCCLNSECAAPNGSGNRKSVEEIRKHIVTTVTVQNLVTGEVNSYEIENPEMEINVGTSDNPEITAIVTVGTNITARDASQTNSNTIDGWKGNVRITWYDDGTYARLTSAGGDWTRVSGSYEMTGKYIRYGQDLSTNARSGRADFTNSYNVAPGWPLGKYGQGNFVGANINGYVNNQYVTITCNYTLF